MWRLVLAIGAALAARPEAPRTRAVPPPAARAGAAPAPALAPVPLDTAPNTSPDPGTPATVDPQKLPKRWEM